MLAPADGNLCVIGDPNQAIYGFRGADASCFERFKRDYPATKAVNYPQLPLDRHIVTASSQMIAARPIADIVRDMHERIAMHAAPTERAEAEERWAIEQMIGGASFFAIDSGRASGAAEASRSFADFAVFYRTDASPRLVRGLARSGIPFKMNSHRPLVEGPAVRAILRELENHSVDTAFGRLRSAVRG